MGYLHPAMISIKTEVRANVHHMATWKLSVDICKNTHSTPDTTVYTYTAPVTAEPGAHFPKTGLNQPYRTCKVPPRFTISEAGLVNVEAVLDISEVGDKIGFGGETGSNVGRYLKSNISLKLLSIF